MAGIKDDNFFIVYKWMLTRLHLKGVALQIFAIIYGFDRDGEGSFTGSLKYLMDFTNTSKNTVLKALKELMEKDYIKKTENIVNGVRFCIYQVNTLLVRKVNQSGEETAPGGGAVMKPGDSAVTEPNNKDLKNKTLIDKEKIKEVINLFNSICISYPMVKVISGKREKEILARLATHSLKDMETAFRNAEKSSFLKGMNERGWSANFDWMINENNFVKILEGNYADKGRREVPGWTEPTLGKAELEAIQRVLQEDVPTENCDHE